MTETIAERSPFAQLANLKPAVLRQRFRHDSLFRNSVYLILSTGVLSGFGLIFWVAAAHLYPTSIVGHATALLSIITLLSGIGLAGFNTALIQFLPTEKSLSQTVNTAAAAVTAVSIAASIAYVLLVPTALHSLIGQGPLWVSMLLLIALVVGTSLNSLTDSVFIARRESQYNLIVYSVFGAVKSLVPVALVALGTIGIITGYAAAVVLALALSLVFMARAYKYRMLARPKRALMARLGKYSLASYLAATLAGLPVLALPSIILADSGAANAAYFYMAATVYALLVVVPTAITQSVMAEGAHDDAGSRDHARHGLKLSLTIMVPVIIVAAIVAPYVLRIFGADYAIYGTGLLRYLVIASLPAAVMATATTVLRLERRTKALIAVSTVPAIVILGAALIWHLTLTRLGLIFVIGQSAGALAGVIAAPSYFLPGFKTVIKTPQP